ncbi:uncharacterized protein LOC113332532 isoform X2 [Papaver somniferum]|uniref:uncharacterized protein LOC113332532 isoform X2 n=1 Tax=Papaver somniferum TaxID=3469 RepID=UPI000E6F521E|nr:uncharacterized protein LOC113332532 isoform X2 [Papaver somniferum]
MEKKTGTNQSIRGQHPNSVTVSASFLLHSSSVLGLAITYWVAQNFFSINLISNPTQTLIFLWVVQSPILILLYSLLRQDPQQCSYGKAVGRGIIGLPIGALIMAFCGVMLGAPIGIQLFLLLVFLGHHVKIGCAYLHILSLVELLILSSVYHLMVLFLEPGLELGLCHLIGKGNGRSGPSVSVMEP